MVKLMENTFRDVNVALANEFARLAERLGVDVWRAREIANLHPRVNVLRPGPGVGGHCIPLDPWFLVQAAPQDAPLIRQARQVNGAQPQRVVALIDRAVGGLRGRRIAALGLAYKADVDDLRESPAVEVVRGLVEGGATVATWEPLVPEASVEGARAGTSLDDALRGAEALVLLVDHGVLRALDPVSAANQAAGRIAIDTRGAWRPEDWEAVGFRLTSLGVGRARG
jgi:UDP-N-acetyl-D-mannosaminuronic acid dehydrogenase